MQDLARVLKYLCVSAPLRLRVVSFPPVVHLTRTGWAKKDKISLPAVALERAVSSASANVPPEA